MVPPCGLVEHRPKKSKVTGNERSCRASSWRDEGKRRGSVIKRPGDAANLPPLPAINNHHCRIFFCTAWDFWGKRRCVGSDDLGRASAGNDRGQGQTSGVPPIRAATPHMGRASTLETTSLVSRLMSLVRGPEVHLANLCQSSSPFSKCPVVDRVGKCWQVCLGRLQLCRLSHPPAASRQYSNSFRT